MNDKNVRFNHVWAPRWGDVVCSADAPANHAANQVDPRKRNFGMVLPFLYTILHFLSLWKSSAITAILLPYVRRCDASIRVKQSSFFIFSRKMSFMRDHTQDLQTKMKKFPENVNM